MSSVGLDALLAHVVGHLEEIQSHYDYVIAFVYCPVLVFFSNCFEYGNATQQELH